MTDARIEAWLIERTRRAGEYAYRIMDEAEALGIKPLRVLRIADLSKKLEHVDGVIRPRTVRTRASWD